ncbi:maleylpyruvate isomerase family mycothiol-dependent enzyme [Kineococcus glutinatus]|uniref:maleylpyruvate isomerase family mycothiol-dependent enzyme n=1 Tax=Kineococcus glutinatus TaxID=1070872 RepID=UPI0031EF2D74
MDGRTHGADAVVAATAAERRRFADLLARLDAAQLAAPSLCAGWDVRTVAGHLVAALDVPLGAFLLAALHRGGRLHRANDDLARRSARRPVAELVAVLRERAENRSAPPVVGLRGPLADVLVHTGDVALPLGLPHDPPPAAVRIALEFATTGRPVGFVRRGALSGLRLVAADCEFAWGGGHEVRGRGIDVLLAACGRAAAASRLQGAGVPLLLRRTGPAGG